MKTLHYKVWEAWGHKIRGETITEDDITDPILRHQEFFFEIDKQGMVVERPPKKIEDCYYIKVKKDKINYILPERFISQMPLKPLKVQDIRLKKSDSIVYKMILDIDTFSIPRQPFIDIEKFVIEEFNPIEHSEPDDFTILKLIALSQEVKLAICGCVSLGKNANLTILRHMLGNYAPKVIKPTQAKLWVTMKNNDYINLDEITSWPAEFVKNVEDICAASADESPDMDKYALGRNKEMEIMGLSKKSLTFTFNRPDELDSKKGIPFEKKWENPTKIIDRFPRLLFKGKVLSHIEKPKPQETIDLMEKNFTEMCLIAAKAQYLINNYEIHMHGWNRDKSIFNSNIRYEANIKPLIDLIDVISKTQDKFDEWILKLNKKHTDYLEMIGQLPASYDNKNYYSKEQEKTEEIDLSRFGVERR